MRAALPLVLLLLAGCTVSPGGATPPDTSDAPPTVTSGAAPPAWSQTRDGWTLSVEPGVLAGYPGDLVDVRATLRGPSGSEGELSAWSWGDPVRARGPVRDGHAVIEARVYVGATEETSWLLSQPDREPIVFPGPPSRLEGVAQSVPFRLEDEVSEHAPGLTVTTEGTDVTLVFAARANATYTSDEAVAASGPLRLVKVGDELRLVAFVSLVTSDAIAPLPEPQRTRVEATMADVPPGDVRVMVVAATVCYCLEIDPPVVHERVVRVG